MNISAHDQNTLLAAVHDAIVALEPGELSRVRVRMKGSPSGNLRTVFSQPVEELDEAVGLVADFLRTGEHGSPDYLYLRVDLLDGSGREVDRVSQSYKPTRRSHPEPVEPEVLLSEDVRLPSVDAVGAASSAAINRSLSKALTEMAKHHTALATSYAQSWNSLGKTLIASSFEAVAARHEAEGAAAIAAMEAEAKDGKSALIAQTLPLVAHVLEKKATQPEKLAELVKANPGLVAKIATELDDETRAAVVKAFMP